MGESRYFPAGMSDAQAHRAHDHGTWAAHDHPYRGASDWHDGAAQPHWYSDGALNPVHSHASQPPGPAARAYPAAYHHPHHGYAHPAAQAAHHHDPASGYHGYHGYAPDHPPHPYPHSNGVQDRAGLRPRAVLHAAGAVISLVLVAAAGVWTWQMIQRDVSGVPVVRALEGPHRLAPDDPGGRQAAFQGLSINELVGNGESAAADEIILAPSGPGLGAQDIAPAASGSPRGATSPAETAPSDILRGGDSLAIPVALQRDLPRAAEPLGFNAPNRLAVTRSPRPPARGADLAAAPARSGGSPAGSSGAASSADQGDDLASAIASSVAQGFGARQGLDIDPASIGPGTRLVQLGAYESVAAAQSAWDGLARRFAPLLDDRGRVIEAAHSGGSVFYRLRAHGFEDERDARRFCAALVDGQVDCIPVLVR
ncbi:MAG: SPOR domain-containing protein [Rhodobacteraceae bacterium]|nr:SPOR domain-containing protein [Paracoccaceae bacterium]